MPSRSASFAPPGDAAPRRYARSVQMTDAGPTDDELRAALDPERLEAFENDLADAASTLEEVERLRRSDESPSSRARAITGLIDDGRFAVGEPSTGTAALPFDQAPRVDQAQAADLTPAVDASVSPPAATTPSDLVGDGDLGSLEQVEPGTELDSATLDPHPETTQVGDSLER